MFRDLLTHIFGLFFVHIGACLRWLYHEIKGKERYSYHAFITDSPLLDGVKKPYREAFEDWKRQRNERNARATTLLNACQQRIFNALKAEGYGREEGIKAMISAGDITLTDTDVFPRNPEYFTNRGLDALIGLLFCLMIVVFYCYIC